MATKSPRMFKTPGGGIVTWTFDADASVRMADHGPWHCSGCGRGVGSDRGMPSNANEHARGCHEIP